MFVSDPAEVDLALRIIILGPLALLWIIAVVRLVGLRSFSKIAAFDFVVTVAVGSLLANAASAFEWQAFLQSTGAMAALLGMQALIAVGRRKWRAFSRLLENRPLLLMRDGKFDRQAMAKARISEDDIRAKLREANALQLDNVRAVVLETTGDISVLHGDEFDRWLLEEVETS
jgi:uncharacterized membrane protein YcaP (DUF421 family)